MPWPAAHLVSAPGEGQSNQMIGAVGEGPTNATNQDGTLQARDEVATGAQCVPCQQQRPLSQGNPEDSHRLRRMGWGDSSVDTALVSQTQAPGFGCPAPIDKRDMAEPTCQPSGVKKD